MNPVGSGWVSEDELSLGFREGRGQAGAQGERGQVEAPWSLGLGPGEDMLWPRGKGVGLGSGGKG